jgi:hypothetical protein
VATSAFLRCCFRFRPDGRVTFVLAKVTKTIALAFGPRFAAVHRSGAVVWARAEGPSMAHMVEIQDACNSASTGSVFFIGISGTPRHRSSRASVLVRHSSGAKKSPSCLGEKPKFTRVKGVDQPPVLRRSVQKGMRSVGVE